MESMAGEQTRRKWRLLFVDDEAFILRGLRRSLRQLESEWDMSFIADPYEAERIVQTEKFDVIVSDMRMPGMSGTELLMKVIEHQPATVRIILSGFSDLDMSIKAVKPTHLYLNKPISTYDLTQLLKRVATTLSLDMDESIRSVMGRITHLPVIPTVYQELLTQLRDPEIPLNAIAELMSRDVGLTAKCLQLINSAFFGISRTITNPFDAVKLLGVETIKALVLKHGIFSQFELPEISEKMLQRFSHHSTNVALLARRIAKTIDADGLLVDKCFGASLLHDVGKLILLYNFKKGAEHVYQEERKCLAPLCQVEVEEFGASHCVIGAFLLSLWGLPEELVSVVNLHHAPRIEDIQTRHPLLTIVYVADALILARAAGLTWKQAAGQFLDMNYLEHVGYVGKLGEWEKMAKSL